jgi:hypothetical protein
MGKTAMSRYQFSDGERWGVYNAQGEKCYLCTRPLDLSSMQIDHIIPERILDNPECLAEVIKEFGLPSDFDINSFENWLPSCAPCNNTKRDAVFKPTPIVQVQLDKAKAHAQEAKVLAEEVPQQRSLARAINVVLRADDSAIRNMNLWPIVERYAQLHREAMEELMRRPPPAGVIELYMPRTYPELRLTPRHAIRYEAGAQLVMTKDNGPE